LVQGAAGMVMYEPESLDKLMQICKENGVHDCRRSDDELWKNRKNICDRLFGKTRHDVLKALTGGTINGNTTFTQELFDAFMMMI
jgi:adenosylmethionine-8-amino-7-oxononanoate aminotransferase